MNHLRVVFFSAVFLFCVTPIAVAASTSSNFFATNYAAQWVSQSQSGTEDQFFHVTAGKEVSFSSSLKNIGKKTWKNSGDEQITFAIYKDQRVLSAPLNSGFDNPTNSNFGKSFFKNSQIWVSDYRVASLLEQEVVPGGTGTIQMSFLIPDNTPPDCYREDISMAAGPKWVKNPVNGDPLQVAHIWVGFCVDSPSPTLSADTKLLQDALQETSEVKKATFSGTVNLEVQGDLAQSNLFGDSAPSTWKKLLFNYLAMQISGKFDRLKKDMQFDGTLALTLTYNGQKTVNTLSGSFLLLQSKDNLYKLYMSLASFDLPLLNLLPTEIIPATEKLEMIAYLHSIEGKWFFMTLPDSDTFFNLDSLLGGGVKFDPKNPLYQVVANLGEDTIAGEKATILQIVPNSKNLSTYVKELLSNSSFSYAGEADSVTQDIQEMFSAIKEYDGKVWITDKGPYVRKETLRMVIVIPNSSSAITITSEEYLNDINKPVTFVIPKDATDISNPIFFEDTVTDISTDVIDISAPVVDSQQLIGQPAPNFTLSDTNGKQYTLSSYKGKKPVLVVIEHTWCAYCQQETPALEAFYTENKAALEVLSISNQEDLATVKIWVEKNGVSNPWLIDEQGIVGGKYSFVGSPHHVLIDKNGIIKLIRAGYATRQDLDEMLAFL